MIRKEKGSLVWYEFTLFEPFKQLRHACFCRHGGYSTDHYASLNVSIHVGDTLSAVKANKQKIAHFFGLTDLYYTHQVHQTNISIALPDNNYDLGTSDGIISFSSQIGCMIQHADCQAAIFYDPMHHILAVIHCGWKGLIQKIYTKTVSVLKNKFGCNPSNLHVGISPSLGPYASEFVDYLQLFPKSFTEFMFRENYFNLWEIAKMELHNVGILSEHIEISSICTLENSHDFFSYRKEKKTGRCATVACLIS